MVWFDLGLLELLCYLIFISFLKSMSMCGYMHRRAVPMEARRGHRVTLELWFHEVLSCPSWMLGTEPGFPVNKQHMLLTPEPFLQSPSCV